MDIQILSKDACTKAIRQIGRIGAKLERHIHIVAVSALSHVSEHRDTTVATNLLNALPKGQRVKALAYWFNHFSTGKLTLKAGKDGQWGAELAKQKDCTPEDFKIEESAATTFAELTAEKEPGKTFTADMLLKKLRAWANEDGMFEDGTTPKVEEACRDLAAAIVASLDKPKLKLVA